MLFAAGRGRGKHERVDDTGEPAGSEPAPQDSHDRDRSITLVNRILEAAGPQPDSRQLMRAILEQIRDWTGCEAAAIRLEEAGDYPYSAEQGFPAQYLSTDNSLVVYDSKGNLQRDDQGRPQLECACGDIIRGRIPPDHSRFTPGGSYWTGSTTEPPPEPAERGYLTALRGRCAAGGYESVACIPLRAAGEVYGILQLNSKEKHRITREVMSVLEPVVAVVATILNDQLTNEDLRHGATHFQALLDAMSEAFTYCRLVYDEEGRPCDWVYVAVNDAFCGLFGLTNPVGKRASELTPGIHRRVPRLLEGSSHVVATGKPDRDEVFIPSLKKWLDARVSTPAPDHFLAMLEDITEQKRAEQALQRTQYSLDHVADYPTWANEAGRIIEVSESACRHLEYSRDELLAMTVFDIDPEVTPATWSDRWRRAKEVGPLYFETVHRTKSGRLYPVEIAVNHVIFGGQECDCGFCRDISERKQTEQRLRLMQYSLDHTDDYQTWLDSKGRLIEVSESTCRHLEYTRDELLSMTIFDIDPCRTPDTWDDFWAMPREAGSLVMESVHRTKSGRLYPVEIGINYFTFGDVEYHCALCRDISDRKRLEESLRMFKLSVDEAPDPIHWIDSEGRLLYVNESYAALSGYSREELQAMRIWDLDRHLTPELYSEHWRQGGEGEGPFSHEATLRTKDGRDIIFELSSYRVDYEGKALGVSLHRDITERKQTEQRLRLMQYSLDHSDDYPLWTDSEGRIVEVSESTCHHLEYTRDELLDMTVFDINPSLTLKEWSDNLKGKRELGTITVEGPHRTKSGRLYPVEVAISLFTFGDVEYGCAFCRDITERKRIEESLLLTQLSVDHAREMVQWIDPEGLVIYANPACCELLGYSPEEMRTLHVWDFDHAITAESWPQEWTEMNEAVPHLRERVIEGKDGRKHPVEISSGYLQHEGKEYGVAYLRDIRERKQAEQALKESEARYRDLFEFESDALMLVDDDSGRFLEVNEAATTLYGYSRTELLKMKNTDLSAEPEQTRLASREPVIQVPLRQHRKKDGTIFPIEGHGRHFEWKGRPVHVVAVRDITERKRGEDELEESRQMLRLILDTVPLRIAWRDRDLRYMGCNIRMALDARLPDTASVVGLRDEELPWGSTTMSSTDDDRDVIRTGIPKLNYDETIVPSTGEPRIMRSSKVPLRDRSGKIIGVLAVHEDVTERTMTIKALQERDEQLRQSQKMEAVGRLAGGIAHDFNNVLTTIIGYSDLILSSPERSDDSLREDIGEIKAAAERASGLTKQILAFSRRQALRPQVLSLNTIISDTERLLARTLGADIELKTVLPPDLGLTEVDEHQFVQILLNLAVNARDAMPRGGTLTLETANVELHEAFCATHPDARPGSYVMLTVSDTGTGMDADTAAHAFEPFYTTKAAGEGTGLGLATVYGVVAQSGGYIYVYSELGLGTTFDIYLPRVDSLAPLPGGDASEREAAGGRETVLVVDDDATFRSMIIRILENRGYRVLPVADGDQAVAILENHDIPVDLLLTDVVLPGSMQGDEIAQMARTLRPRLPVLFMSAYTRDTIVHARRLQEDVDYLEKPFTADDLARRVRKILDSN